jgi:hypothetical protein
MTRDQIYEIWRPSDSPWSRWVKPGLFSFMGDEELSAPGASRWKWEVPPPNGTAIVANLPGDAGVALGLALCFQGGYRPIPVYNACPYATYDRFLNEIVSVLNPMKPVAGPALIEVAPIMSAIARFSLELKAAQLPPAAPPAFLIDEHRHGASSYSMPVYRWFDNRSFLTTADFPSASFFKVQGVSRIVVIQRKGQFQTDLLQVLLAWQSGGLTIAEQEPWEPWDPRVINVKPPSVFRSLWDRWVRLGYHRNPSGAFGQSMRASSG